MLAVPAFKFLRPNVCIAPFGIIKPTVSYRPEVDRELEVPHAPLGTASNPNIDPNVGHGLKRIVTNANEHTIKEINYNSIDSEQLRTIMNESLAVLSI